MPSESSVELNVAEAKKRFSELLGRVAYGGESVVILRRGKPVARIVPVSNPTPAPRLSDVEGWLDDDDEFFSAIEDVLRRRGENRPRVFEQRAPE